MSDTPMVDDRLQFAEDVEGRQPVILASFARQLERELQEARIQLDVLVNMFDRIEREAFSLDDTIGGEEHDAYIIRKVSQLKAEIEALKQEIAERNERDGCA